jgi:hypothetical protein
MSALAHLQRWCRAPARAARRRSATLRAPRASGARAQAAQDLRRREATRTFLAMRFLVEGERRAGNRGEVLES